MKRLGVFVLVILAVVTMIFVGRLIGGREERVSRTAPSRSVAEKVQEPADARSEISGKYHGLCKKNSIASVDDFRRTVQNDPVLAAHFADFRWETARLGRQDEPVWTYVSYRKDGVVRRTTKPVRLPKGDGYITDGNHVVRTYCCNDYVIAPSPETTGMASPASPVERVDAPPRRANGAAGPAEESPHDPSPWSPLDNSPAKVAASLEKESGYPPAYPYTPSYFSSPTQNSWSSPKKKPNPDHIVTPEPGTLYMVGTAVGMYGLLRLIRRRRPGLQ